MGKYFLLEYKAPNTNDCLVGMVDHELVILADPCTHSSSPFTTNPKQLTWGPLGLITTYVYFAFTMYLAFGVPSSMVMLGLLLVPSKFPFSLP